MYKVAPGHFDSLLASFLALWMSVLQKVDLFSERCVVHECFEQVLEDWKDKDDLCFDLQRFEQARIAYVRASLEC